MSEPSSSIEIYRRLLSYLKPHLALFSVAVVAMVIYGATDGAIPFLLKHILDDIFGARDENKLWFLVAAILIFATVRSIFGFLHNYLANTVGLRIIRDLRDELGRKLLDLHSAFFGKNSSGSLVSRMTNDTLLVREALTSAVVSLARDTVRIIVLVGAAFYLDPFLALITIVAFPVCILPIMKFGKRIRKLSRIGQDQLGGLTAMLFEIITGHKVIKAFSLEKREAKRFAEENDHTTKTYVKAAKYGALTAPTNEFIGSIAVAAVIVYGGLSVIGGVRTQGDFIAFITTMFLLYDPLKRIGKINTTIQQGVAAADRIFELLDTQTAVTDAADAKPLADPAGSIRFKNISFQHDSRTTTEKKAEPQVVVPTLRDVSFEVPSGTSCALVGLSGSGKSTLVSLLPRFYDVSSGAILIGEQNIQEVTLNSLRGSIAFVSQHTFLFNDSVFHNIEAGRPGASQEEVEKAALAAHAHEFISSLPEGYNTIVGEQGMTLSGGERARVAIARALLKDAPILILDEATANLDSQSEMIVQAAIERLMRGRTVIVIAHRLSTIRNADQILVMSAGKIVERGTHIQLLERKGEYAKLHALQFSDHEPKLVGTA